jgi:hypothetical protein
MHRTHELLFIVLLIVATNRRGPGAGGSDGWEDSIA